MHQNTLSPIVLQSYSGKGSVILEQKQANKPKENKPRNKATKVWSCKVSEKMNEENIVNSKNGAKRNGCLSA